MRRVHPLTASFPTLFLLIAPAAAQTADVAGPAPPVAAAESDASGRALLVRGNTAFALDLYRELITEGDGNVFIAPHSISTALAMTYAGARGETAAQIADALHFDLDPADLHPAFAALADELAQVAAADGATELGLANRVWIQQGLAVRDAFAEILRDRYGGGLEAADFVRHAADARQAINAWVEERTRGRIVDLLQPSDVTPSTVLVLTNAVSFDGTWRTRFDAEETREGPFFVTPTTSVTVPLMTVTSDFAHTETPEAHVVELPYEGDRLSMVLVVPKERDGLHEIEASLTVPALDRWLGELTEEAVRVVLPRFALEDRRQLERTLPRLGMPLAFVAGSADFSGICGAPGAIWIDLVVHQGRIAVDEAGTEAAAATAVTMKRGGPPRLPVVRADRPFLFLIRDRATGTILFLGRLVRPAVDVANAR